MRAFPLLKTLVAELIGVYVKFHTIKNLESVPSTLKRPPRPLDASQIHLADWYTGNPPLQPSPQPQCGKVPHQVRPRIPSGGLSDTSRGGRNSNRGVSGAISGRDGPAWSVRRTETLVLSRIRAGAQPILERYGEGQVGLPEPLLEGGHTHPWPNPGDTCGSGPSE